MLRWYILRYVGFTTIKKIGKIMQHAQYRKKDGKSTRHSSCSSLAEALQKSLDTGGAGWLLWHLNRGRISGSGPRSDGPKSCLPLAVVIWLNYKSTASTFSSSNLIFCWSLRKSNSLISHGSLPLGIKMWPHWAQIFPSIFPYILFVTLKYLWV